MICRVCLQEADCPLNIFDVNGEQLDIANILQQHFWFRPSPEDAISTVICRACWFKVNDFHKFYVIVEQAHLAYKSSLGTAGTIKAEDEVEVQVEIKEEYLENVWHEDVVEGAESLLAQTIIGAINPLYEPELDDALLPKETESGNGKKVGQQKGDRNDIEEKSDETDEEEDDDSPGEDNQDSSDAKDELNTHEDDGKKASVSKKPTTRTTRATRESKQNKAVKKKTTKATKRKTAKKVVYSDDEEDDVDLEKPKRPKYKSISSRDDEVIKKHVSMNCDLCAFVGEDFMEMRIHFRLEHNDLRPYVMCCNRKISNRYNLVQHAYKHEDPEFFKCKECNKVYSDSSTLRSHMLANHPNEEELTFECDECSKKFSRLYLLKLHKPSHIPINERKFICTECPESKAHPFASDHLLQIHINMRHKKSTNICHVCAKEIRDKQSFEKHVRLHFEDSGPRIKCPRPDCDSWLKDKDNLRQHLRRHNDVGKIFTCNQCGKLCKNRRALSSHMNYVHKEEIHKCEECNKAFKRAITLKEHMAQHTGESLYKCPFCTRTFNSNANMHSHKKKMHPVEWENWRKTKRGSCQTIISNRPVANSASNEGIV